MSDLIYLAVIAGFFAAAVGLLRACEHIIGSDAPSAASPSTEPTVEAPASTRASEVRA